MQILNSLVPIFAVIGLGIVLRRQDFLTRDTTQGFNRFAYYFALPVFLFYKLGGALGSQQRRMVFGDAIKCFRRHAGRRLAGFRLDGNPVWFTWCNDSSLLSRQSGFHGAATDHVHDL